LDGSALARRALTSYHPQRKMPATAGSAAQRQGGRNLRPKWKHSESYRMKITGPTSGRRRSIPDGRETCCCVDVSAPEASIVLCGPKSIFRKLQRVAQGRATRRGGLPTERRSLTSPIFPTSPKLTPIARTALRTHPCRLKSQAAPI